MSDLLFGPMNEKDLRRQYPELTKVPEFSKLSAQELLFVWWYSNPTSPLITDENLNEKYRVGNAYDKAFKSHPNEDRRKKYLSFDFDQRMRLAIDRMRGYSPSARIRSKKIVEEILSNFEKMAKVDMEKDFSAVDEEGKVTINWSGRNQYVNSAAKISEILPQLIKQVEEGFGVTESKDAEDVGMKAIGRFHSQIKEE